VQYSGRPQHNDKAAIESRRPEILGRRPPWWVLEKGQVQLDGSVAASNDIRLTGKIERQMNQRHWCGN